MLDDNLGKENDSVTQGRNPTLETGVFLRVRGGKKKKQRDSGGVDVSGENFKKEKSQLSKVMWNEFTYETMCVCMYIYILDTWKVISNFVEDNFCRRVEK